MFVQRLTIQNQSVQFFGDGLYQAQVNHLNSFIIHPYSIIDRFNEVKIITYPSEYPCEIKLIDNHDGTWIVNYIPKEIGQIQIDLVLNNQSINNIPFKINIFDINQIYISNLNNSFINQLNQFHIDTSKAGIGQLEVIVENGQVSCDLLSYISSQYDVTFLPHKSGLYKIDIKFNGLIIPGSPFSCSINDLSSVIVSNNITNAHVGHKLSFDIDNQSKSFDIHIVAPSGRYVSFQSSQLNENQTRIDYILDEIGLHQVNVRTNDNMNTYGSSFSLQAYDTNRIIVSDIPHSLVFNQPVEFIIDASKAGEGELEVDINNGLIPTQVKSLGKLKFHFTFLPLLNELHRLSIKFNGQQLPGFPKECKIISSDNIKIQGPGINQVLLNTPTWFKIDIPHCDLSNLKLTIITPINEILIPSTLLTSDGFQVDWTPTEIGTYNIQAIIDDKPILEKPFHVKCYDPKKIIVIPPINDSSIHKPTKFLIDVSKAGEGNLEISVNCSGQNIPNQITSIGNRRFEFQFIPQKAMIHQCHILFNGEIVPGSPFSVNVMDMQCIMAIGKGLGSIPIHIPTSFTILSKKSLGNNLRCSIKGPDDHLISCIMTKLDPNRYEVTYIPDCVGEFRIEILYDNIPIDKSPFISRSFDVNKIQIQDFPFSTFVGSSTSFLIDATNSGSGNLEIAISRNGKNIPNYVQNEGGARFRIKFIPDQSSIHHVSIKFNGIEIHGSPFLCNVYSHEFLFENYEYTSIDKQTLFSLKPKSNSLLNPNIYIDIITPSGKQIPKNISSINFIPNEIGQHEIRFYNNDEKQILLKKFLCQVYDINKIHISDLPIAIVHQRYKFTINTTDAGNDNLLVKIKQNEKKISHEQIQISTHIYEISFTPETSDDCTVQISFNDENSLRTLVIPVKIACDQIIISSIPSGIVGQPVIFTINLTELNLLSIVITESHSGKILSHTMTLKSSDKNQYQISFIPNIARQHTISITYDGKLISTHHIDVCNVNKIRVSSINDGIVGIPSIFSVDTHGAGEGHLEVTVSDGQRTLPAQLKTIQARKFDIAFVPEISGKHSINITFNGIPIEGNPFIINVQESSNDNSIEDDDNDDHEFIIGGQLQGTKVGEVAWLICETSLTDIYEDLDFYVTDPDEIVIKHTRIQDSAGRWRIEFEPKKSGIYQIQIDIDQTSMILASIEILPLNYERNIYGERIVHPNLLNYFSINSPNENLKIQLRSSNGKEIPLEIERDSLEWKIYFTLIEIDCYQLSITDDTNNEQLFEIHCVTEEIDLFRNGGIEDIARLIIDHSKISIGDINVIVKDSLAHTIPAAFYRNTKNDLIIEYIPVRKDIHEVFIRTQNNLLDICPIRIMSFQSKNTFDPVLRVQVKEFLEHTFSGVIDHDNKLEINITDPFERSIPFQRSKNEQGELTISVLPVRVGTHWIRISNNENDSFALIPIFSFDDDYVPLSPIATPSIEKNQINNIQEFIPLARDLTTISETSEIASSSRAMSISPEHFIKSNRDSSMNISSIINDRMSPEVQILDINDLDDPCIGIQSKFSLQDPDDQFNILIYDANENKISYQIERLPDGRKSISYEPTIVGPIEIHILKDNQPIDGSPLIVHAFDPSTVQITNFPQKILMNKINTFSIDATKAGKGSLKITIKDSNNQSLPVNTEKKSNDKIVIQFQPTTCGKHIISILFNRIPIPKTPLEIFIENIEERGRSIYSKYDLLSFGQQQQQQKISLETIYSRTSNDNSSSLFNEQEIEKFHLLKTKFEHKQPLDLIFDPRQYPFKIYFQSSFPSINTDIHLSINLPHITSVNITINQLKIPLQIIHNNIQTPILKFRPIIAGDYSIILKDSHGQEFPYILPVYNPNGIHIEPFNYLQSINDCHFICNIDNIGQGKFFLMVYYQSKPIRISYKIQTLSKTSIQIRLFPLKIGTYRIYLAYRNLPINGLPIDITVYDLQGISLNAEYKEPVVAKTPVAYKVNTSQAGQGELKVELIPPETSIIPCQCHVHKLNPEEYLIEYIPYESGQYKLRILFNNQLIQGKTFDTNVYSVLSIPLLSTNVHIEKILPNNIPKIGDEIYLQIMTDKSFIHGQVSFNGISIPCQLQQTDDNKQLWHLKFRPYAAGIYKIHLFHNGLSILHSPYLIEVKDIDRKNYLSGIVNRPFMIEIHTKSILNSQIRAVVLLGSNQIPSTMTIVDEHLIQINFIPYEPGFYFINIYNGNQSIEGSPFLIRIKRPQVVEISGMCLDHLRLNDLGIFRIHCHGQRETVNAKIFYLSNNDRCDNGQLISFQLLETYEQLIQFSSQIFINLLLTRLRLTKERIQNLTIQDNNGHATISFQLIEIPKQLPTNEQVINTLRNLIDKQILNLIDPNQYILHTICGSLVIGEPINVKLFSLPNGDYLGEFTPNKIGRYRIDTTFGGKHINDSPIYTEIYDPLQVRIGYLPKEFIVGIEYTFDIDINKAGNAPLEVFILSPSGIKVPCKIDETLSKIKKVHFTPIEIGYHDLNVKFGSDMISGTPIKIMVNNTRVITAYGDGLYQGLQNKITTFMIDTKEIEGDLNIRIEDSNSIIKNTLERINKNLFKITYTPNEVGYINISIKWNGKDIINSPFTVIINNPEHVQMVNDQQSIIDSQNHIRMKINEEKTLCFDTSHAGPGNLKATIQSIDNDSIPIHIDQQGNFYILNFTLIREGEYDLMITYGNNLLPNMPIRLIGYDQYSPLKVICSGDGLKMGIIGKEMKCLIDTRLVNPGDITVQCQGNHKKAFCRLVNNQDGTFYLFIKPEETGKHLLTIKYNGKDVPGSPYTVKVSGPSDARKVRVYGPGIQHGVLSTFQSHFICETKGAGAGQLSVEIRGPKDAFRVEMQRRNIQDRTIICRYYPTEPGDYLLSVKWSGEHVYGSPFHTHLFQSQQEFDQYQQFH